MRLSVIVATLEGCSFNELNDAPFLERILDGAIQASGLTLLAKNVHAFEPQGVTAMAMLAESHIALHSWPERGLLFVDIATCSEGDKSRLAFDFLCAHLQHATVDERRWRVGPGSPGS